MSVHRITVAVTGLATAVVLTACGSGDGTSAQSASSVGAGSSASVSSANAADVTFAQQMTVHHEQAVEMAQLAADRSGSAEVRDLAARIEAAQGPEIETMAGWLDRWGTGAPTSGTGHGGHGSGAMPGGMSAAETDRLTGLSGGAFDREFLTLMIDHHEGAVDMARTEQAEGHDPDAVALAARVVADQTAEIAEMEELLGRL
ncbi:DUF305 domain-containing protein [Modestobacter versicolor]|uniref:DUF305 domain-containing protein n=1 Tax=Modestobacter versicolor TaxID=429133 RepID=UPI0034DF96D3